MISIESVYPALDRTAYLIEHACVPRFYPPYCAEIAQLLALIEAARQQHATQTTNEVKAIEH